MTVVWTDGAEKDLRGIDRAQARRIVERMLKLAADPHGRNVKRLRGGDGECRLRVGDYRVIYETDGDAIRVLHVAHRREAYR